ncbi:flavodoxin family protein [bacterium]|nr:flavodoxin family protein [bacterium]
MRILSILGSPRLHGNTSAILDLIESHLESLASESSQDLTIDRLDISSVKLQPCKGCRLCFDKGETFCPNKDELLKIKARFDAADGILCSSPVYVSNVSGSLKTLIDRLAFVCHRPAFYGKSVYLIATTGGSPVGATLNAMSGAFLSWGAHLVGRKGFSMGARMSKSEAQEKFGKTCGKIAAKLFTAIVKEKAYNPSFIELMIFRTQQNTWSNVDPQRLDFQYWHDNGWTDRKVSYFMPHRANFIKVNLARFVGGVLSRIWG